MEVQSEPVRVWLTEKKSANVFLKLPPAVTKTTDLKKSK